MLGASVNWETPEASSVSSNERWVTIRTSYMSSSQVVEVDVPKIDDSPSGGILLTGDNDPDTTLVDARLTTAYTALMTPISPLMLDVDLTLVEDELSAHSSYIVQDDSQPLYQDYQATNGLKRARSPEDDVYGNEPKRSRLCGVGEPILVDSSADEAQFDLATKHQEEHHSTLGEDACLELEETGREFQLDNKASHDMLPQGLTPPTPSPTYNDCCDASTHDEYQPDGWGSSSEYSEMDGSYHPSSADNSDTSTEDDYATDQEITQDELLGLAEPDEMEVEVVTQQTTWAPTALFCVTTGQDLECPDSPLSVGSGSSEDSFKFDQGSDHGGSGFEREGTPATVCSGYNVPMNPTFPRIDLNTIPFLNFTSSVFRREWGRTIR
ncbi:hypothetical protein DRE_00815 [Drechslerella stenobrocha 248]|uniref:Uncharacterized protein n=1 Tax=Drechslerella stenobrocha 248 TaxID=1043628 RepID=W7HN04_9PEZI|nr:hypothetical protein DRE_00815 [Drechslerella stenobrocha 248]